MADVYKTHLAHNTRKEAKKGVPVNPAIPVGNYETDFHDYRAESPNSQTGEKVKHQLLSQLQVDSLTAQMERLRVSLRERDIEIRERRNQRDLENLESETAEAPIIIRRLKDELVAARTKVKTYYAQIGEDSRVIRQMHDEHLKQKQALAKLESLVSQKNLADRDILSAQLVEANGKVSELQKQWTESERKLEIVDRNLNSDNRYLRGKIAAMEKEKELVLDQLKQLEENIKEKEKVIASLSIYRYNAIHKKQDAGCKVCSKREKEEAEAKKKQDIIDSLPMLEIKKLTVTSGTSIEFQLQLAKEYEPDHKFTYSQLRLLYSADPSMVEAVQKKKLDTVSYQKSNDFVFKMDGFTSGTTYYFAIVSGHQDVFGAPCHPKQALVDASPNPPKLVTTMVLHNPPAIQILFQSPEYNKSSKVLRYKVYQSNTPDFADQYLAMDLPAEIFEFSQQDNMTITISDAHTAVPYYFKLSASNAKGESILSTSSTETIIDFPPEKPGKPLVKRLSMRSFHVSSICPPGAGTFPSKFKVTMVTSPKITNAHPVVLAESKVESTVMIPATIHISGKREVHYTVNDVDPLLSYTFSVVAVNSTGFSESSEWSDDVDIDYLVPALTDLKVSVTSASSFTVVAPSSKEIKHPPINGFKVQWANNYDMTENVRTSSILPCDLKTHVFDDLADGEIIYVTACLVGEEEEGMPCTPVFVPLATSIPLPPSPLPPGSKEDLTAPPPPGELKKASSSRLSIHEKAANMHFGYSAYHEPPTNPNAIKTRGSTLRRSQTSIENQARNSQSSIRGAARKVTIQSKGSLRVSDTQLRKSVNRSGSLPQISK